ncbi:hypothetical protein OAF53_00385 [Akkermansiaceae bacterium]|nr:hypothetical protein [Akkermansiaceae bacterium]
MSECVRGPFDTASQIPMSRIGRMDLCWDHRAFKSDEELKPIAGKDR